MSNCPYCAEFSASSFKRLLHHIKFVHSADPNFSISCGHCNQTFKKFESFKSHLRRKHRNELEDEGDINNLLGFGQDGGNGVGSESDDENGNVQEDEPGTGRDTIESITRFIALFIMKTKEENQLSQQAMNSIMDNTEALVDQSLDALRAGVTSCLMANSIDIATIEGLDDVLKQPSIFSKARIPLTSHYQQVKYFVENFNYIEPKTIVLSQRAEYQTINGVRKLKTLKETFQYIPILKTLKALLNQPDVLTEVYNSHASHDGTLKDFCDGEDFKMHPLFGTSQAVLILHCYFDEFEVTNALGSKTRKHTIGAFYFTLANLRARYRSCINTIQLFALCKVPLIKTYGINRILLPFMQDIRVLESDAGVIIKVEGTDKTFRGSIGPFSSDNLGAHAIGGFIECFTSLRVCRICMATREDIQQKFTEEQFQLRTRDSHDRHCEMVTKDPTLCSVYGVKKASVLNQSQYFHTVDGLDLDIMHDQLEGVLPLEIKMFLRQCIQVHRVTTLAAVNERIASFNYGSVDQKNKPSPLKQQIFTSDSASISQSAAQMWCLARMFPLLLGDLIQADDEKWGNLLRLLQIEEIIFSPICSIELAAYLAVLVKDYLEQFGQNYPHRRIIPKQHYMVHYPRQITRRGPLIQNWAMRFEAKHNYFKKLVDKINNFKNIDLSLARRHQTLQAYLLQQSGNFFRSSLELGPGEQTTVNDANIGDMFREVDEEITGETVLTITSWVKVFGTKYCRGCVIVTGLHYGQPAFGEVKKILVVMGNIIFQYKTLQVLEYCQHLNAFQVKLLDDVQFIKQEQLQDFHPLGTHRGFGNNADKLFVVLRYRVDCMM